MIFLGVFAVAMAFALYTRHASEDFYITYRASKNLATGHGLVLLVGAFAFDAKTIDVHYERFPVYSNNDQARDVVTTVQTCRALFRIAARRARS
jgi:hypothetical protein